jgi:hypothetical protein
MNSPRDWVFQELKFMFIASRQSIEERDLPIRKRQVTMPIFWYSGNLVILEKGKHTRNHIHILL